jgi:hypothetical protein
LAGIRIWKSSAGGVVVTAAIYTAAIAVLLAPALWNGYPLLQYDTGGYLARWYEGYLVPSRSTVFGLYLHLGEGWHFWPIVITQSALTVWVIALTLRAFGLGKRFLLLAIIAALSALTSLPWLSSILLTDIFAVLSVLALYLVVFKAHIIGRIEKAGLVLLMAFAGATHSVTLAMLLGLVAAGALSLLLARSASVRGLMQGLAAVVLGAAMLLAANFSLCGQLAWTPGGYGIMFGRMLQDGIVARYLKEHCPDPALRLCPFRAELPTNADEFLWSYGIFNKLGRFNGLGDEMRVIVLRSLTAYPAAQIETAATATVQQLVMVASGAGVNNRIWHTYGIFDRFIRSENPAMLAARQQQGALDFTALNRVHVPVALASMVLMLGLLFRFRHGASDDLAQLAATATLAILANAFLCGALSGPHDRYGARIAWLATFAVAIAAARAVAEAVRARAGHAAVTAVP